MKIVKARAIGTGQIAAEFLAPPFAPGEGESYCYLGRFARRGRAGSAAFAGPRSTGSGTSMQLSADLYSQIVKDLVSDGLGEFGRQQRREPRVGMRARAYILPTVSATVPLPVRVRDVSIGGMGLLLPTELGPDRLFLLLLPKGGGKPPVRLACTVAHCQALGEDLYAVGARFARWDEVAALGPDVTCKSREWPVRGGSAKAKLAQRLTATPPATAAAETKAQPPGKS